MFVSETAKEPNLRAVIGAIDAGCDVAAFLLGGGLRLFVGGGLRLLWCSVLDEAADAPGRGDSKPAVQSLRVQGQSGGYAQREEKQGFV